MRLQSLVVLALSTGLLVVGCNAGDDEAIQADGPTGAPSATGGDGVAFSASPTPMCPVPPADPVVAQHKAGEVLNYIIGGASPFPDDVACPPVDPGYAKEDTACSRAKVCANGLRDTLAATPTCGDAGEAEQADGLAGDDVTSSEEGADDVALATISYVPECPTRENAPTQQRKATQLLNALFFDGSRTSAPPPPFGTKVCQQANGCLQSFKDMVIANGCKGSPAAEGPDVCGLDTGVITITCSRIPLFVDFNMAECSEKLDGCYGRGLSKFFFVDTDVVLGQTIFKVDPEPAKLKAALPASTGASAGAFYLNTNVGTNVRYYSGSWTYDPSGPSAGTPCSTSSLVENAITYQVIQVSAVSYRRCY